MRFVFPENGYKSHNYTTTIQSACHNRISATKKDFLFSFRKSICFQIERQLASFSRPWSQLKQLFVYSSVELCTKSWWFPLLKQVSCRVENVWKKKLGVWHNKAGLFLKYDNPKYSSLIFVCVPRTWLIENKKINVTHLPDTQRRNICDEGEGTLRTMNLKGNRVAEDRRN